MELVEIKKKIKRELLTSVPILLLSFIFPILAWFGVFQLEDNSGIWFQRSGSVTVLFAVWVEFKLFKLAGLTNPISENGKTYDDMRKSDYLQTHNSKKIQIIKYLAAVLAISGTVIWGYGDLIFISLSQ
ncbi:hypothetical protein AAHL06_002949 [Vibrio parahaemolyticus]|uniref:hypothetical protein n=1 Tax=Vibrio alginolyticus TaxID=663 RepID=UPI00215C82DC|nr:hypothetical protein [Vibrio alginolyticus]EGQ9145700.1 hypothetical protein [Vibrio parahaemolyticus]EGR1571821.1 hypothetical protein [Vibrio alginolyticus]EJG1613391.1 hypothetical protein [Vibrio parahaemolyticus]EJZ8378524.1 hypothetical protein [Vibrio parahaemolyticus]EKC8022441.1 hypothetical protein [Vibrio parahaemolyticus]